MRYWLILLLIVGCSTGHSFAVDSCLENDDGQDYSMPGEVRGYANGTMYRFTDFCLYNGTLVEYACDGTSYTRETVDCECERTSFDIGFCE
jgi:hypothetical protein